MLEVEGLCIKACLLVTFSKKGNARHTSRKADKKRMKADVRKRRAKATNTSKERDSFAAPSDFFSLYAFCMPLVYAPCYATSEGAMCVLCYLTLLLPGNMSRRGRNDQPAPSLLRGLGIKELELKKKSHHHPHHLLFLRRRK